MKVNKFARGAGVAVLGALLTAIGLTDHFLSGMPSGAAEHGLAQTRAGHRSVLDKYGTLPLSFEPNQGQTDRQVKFLARGAGYGLFLTPTKAVLALSASSTTERWPGADLTSSTTETPPATAVLGMQFVGANPAPAIRGLNLQSGTTNYFIGNDPTRWHTGILNYSRVEYVGLYPGIDIAFHGMQGRLEYDVRVAPGADPAAFGLTFRGADDVSVDSGGNLVLRLGDATLVQRRPVAWQVIGGSRHSVEATFAVSAARRVSFHLNGYDRGRPLTIDPTLSYSTYLGGASSDSGIGIAVDALGSAYVSGNTGSADLPTTAGAFKGAYSGGGDAFVAKLNPTGNSLSYSTYLGGTAEDTGFGIAVDASGSAYVAGLTNSTDFPTANAFQSVKAGGYDAYVAKLSPTGDSLAYSTYLGGTAFDRANRIAVDASGSAYVIGSTGSADFPTANPLQGTYAGFNDAFVAKLSPAGNSLAYSTYLGGTGGDDGGGIAVDVSGSAYVTGETSSTDFPTANPFQATYAGNGDAFVAKLSPAGDSLAYSTYLGGTGQEVGGGIKGIAVDASGSAYVTGATLSTDFPTVNAFQNANAGGSLFGDAFVTKVTAAGDALAYSTYLGGSGDDFGFGIAVDASSSTYVTGETSSTDFPTANAFQSANAGGTDAFVTKFSPAGNSLSYSTYLGGTSGAVGLGIAVDASGSGYVTGNTHSTDFPTANPFQASNAGATDAFVTKISTGPGTPATVTLSPADADNPVGTQHTVTATEKDASAQPVPSITVRFAVTGSVNTTGSCVTDTNGQCNFTYTGPQLPGADLINAYADTNGNGSPDPGEPVAAPATKAWIPPTSTPGQANGGGQFLNSGGTDKIAFGFGAKNDNGKFTGECSVVDPSTKTTVKCTDVTNFVESGTHATVFGHATVNGFGTTYRIDVDDLANPGKGKDKFAITTGTGYTAGGVLTAGNIQVH